MTDQNFIRHILEAIERIESYTKGISNEEFIKNFLIQDAVMRNLEIIGEASKKISQVIKARNTSVPWKKMAGLRDKLIHDYFGVDLISIWTVIETDLKELKQQLQTLSL
jgi:uncharacterized protein with HEPN domain